MLSEERIAMSQPERDVLKVMGLVLTGERTQLEAARLLGKSMRQVRRISAYASMSSNVWPSTPGVPPLMRQRR